MENDIYVKLIQVSLQVYQATLVYMLAVSELLFSYFGPLSFFMCTLSCHVKNLFSAGLQAAVLGKSKQQP